MPQTSVSSCVLSIIASFSSGLDVFRKCRETPKGRAGKIKKASKPPSDEEVELVRSLRQGPEDIGREYQRSIQAVGDQFAIGDAIAQTSLAEILLKLNTGLVSIINGFLRYDNKTSGLDCQSLTVLSERCRVDTCRTLRQLYKRLLPLRASSPRAAVEQASSDAAQTTPAVQPASRPKQKGPAAKHKKNTGPMLARVVIENSAKRSQIALVKPGERKKQPRRTGASQKPPTASPPALPQPASTPDLLGSIANPSPTASTALLTTTRLPDPANNHSAEISGPAGSPLARPDIRRATRSTPGLSAAAARDRQAPPPRSRTAPAPMPTPRTTGARRRKPTPTYYSIESGSTRLGEIPMHKWAEPYDFDAMSILNREAARNGWPQQDLGYADAAKKKRALGIFRMFRKGNRTAA